MFVAHRERHHSLVKTGFAEERLWVLVDELENAFAAPFDFCLQSAHTQKLIARPCQVKAKESPRGRKIFSCGYGQFAPESD